MRRLLGIALSFWALIAHAELRCSEYRSLNLVRCENCFMSASSRTQGEIKTIK